MMPSLCEQFWQCPNCGVVLKVEYRKSELHECGEIERSICHEFHLDENHQCYMRALSPEQDKYKFIFNDFKCHQNNENSEHIPNFVVAHSVCDECEINPVDENVKCTNCGSRCAVCDKYNKTAKEWEKDLC